MDDNIAAAPTTIIYGSYSRTLIVLAK